MPQAPLLESAHFTLQPLANGVYACIHRPGGAAFSNAGIIDLGDQTLIVDATHTRAAGSALRRQAEALFGRPVETAILTHAHLDHWIGACALEAGTRFLSGRIARQVCQEWAPLVLEDFQNPVLWAEMLQETGQQLEVEQDRRRRAEHEHMRSFFQYILAERAEFQPRIPDQTFEGPHAIMGSQRTVELHTMGPGHSEEDSVILLPQDGIAFIGDIGFFDTQPQLNGPDLDLLRRQINFFSGSAFQTLVPGHGPAGGQELLKLELEYIDTLEDLVGEVVRRGGSLPEALRITLPQPFDSWLVGGMGMFEGNVSALFKRAGGEMPPLESHESP